MKTILIISVVLLVYSVVAGVKAKQVNIETNIDTISSQDISIKCIQIRNGNYIIRSETEYRNTLKIMSSYPDCGNCELPIIDFSNYTLLGIKTSSGGCGPPETHHFVIKNKLNEKYQFILNVKQKGFCKINFAMTVWCLIPKIESNAVIDFKIVKN